MCELLKRVSRQVAVTVLHVTHSVNEAQRLADCLFRLEHGAVTQVSAVTKLSPRSFLVRCEFAEQRTGQGERRALGPLVQAVGDDAVALAVPPGLQGHTKLLGDPLGRGRVAVTQAELAARRLPSWR